MEHWKSSQVLSQGFQLGHWESSDQDAMAPSSPGALEAANEQNLGE